MVMIIPAAFIGAFAVSAGVVAESPTDQGTRTERDVAAFQQWTVNLEGYLVLRDQALCEVRPPTTSEPREFLEAQQALARAIRARRPDARIGDLFSFDVRRALRKAIARALTESQTAVADVIAAITAEIVAGAPPVRVNEPFPWQLGAAMPPRVLAALPSLPQGLQYRFVGRDLILIDLDANLVIDILPEAIPQPANQGTGTLRKNFID
jgi:hypothetical protein